MDKQKKLIEMLFYAVLFVGVIIFLIYKGLQPADEPTPIPSPPPIVEEAPMQSSPELWVEDSEPTPLLPQNIPYWELD